LTRKKPLNKWIALVNEAMGVTVVQHQRKTNSAAMYKDNLDRLKEHAESFESHYPSSVSIETTEQRIDDALKPLTLAESEGPEDDALPVRHDPWAQHSLCHTSTRLTTDVDDT
jgi:hypothetical protein